MGESDASVMAQSPGHRTNQKDSLALCGDAGAFACFPASAATPSEDEISPRWHDNNRLAMAVSDRRAFKGVCGRDKNACLMLSMCSWSEGH